MEDFIFFYAFIGFLARGMLGTFIGQKLGTDLMLFCKPVNYIGAGFLCYALVLGEITAVQFGFFMSDVLLVVFWLTRRKPNDEVTETKTETKKA